MSTSTTTLRDPVGINEIAERLHVEPSTVRSWRTRGKHMTRQAPMPEPKLHLTNTPLWEWSQIGAWAEETGRL
jgi:hypothetical protein